MLKKASIFVIILCLTVYLVSGSVSAHTTSQEGIIDMNYIEAYDGYYVGGEDMGWSIDEDFHAGTTTIAYRVYSETGAVLSPLFCLKISQGAALWNPTVNITTDTGNATTVGDIYIYDILETDTVARFTNYFADANGHLTEWEIQINNLYYNEFTPDVIAHELGHVIGLNDLYDISNVNKLMYGFVSGTATAPTTSDIWGAKVITGQHSTHTWTSDPYRVHTCTDCGGYGEHIGVFPYSQHNASYHKATCKACGNTVYESHTNSIAGICKLCGYEGMIQLGVSDEAA